MPNKRRDIMAKRKGLERSTDEFIQYLIYRQMWDSDWRRNTADEVRKEVRALKLKNEK